MSIAGPDIVTEETGNVRKRGEGRELSRFGLREFTTVQALREKIA